MIFCACVWLVMQQDKLSRISFGTVEEIDFVGAFGDRVHAWVIEPKDKQPDERYPLALIVHGGPQGAWKDWWMYRWFGC